MESSQMIPFFHLLFQFHLFATMIFQFENNQSLLSLVTLAVNYGLQNT